jgi:LuxR family transcriptional regulator, maltose regulon positive regulatory protein
MAFLHYLRGEYLQAFEIYEDALAKASQSGNHHVMAFVLTGIGDLYLDLDTLQTSLDFYYQARPIVEQIGDQFLMIYLDLAEAAVARLNGEFSHARILLNAANQIIERSPSDYSRSLYLLEAGRLALAERNFPQASNDLANAAELFEEGGQRVESGRARLLLAAACFEMGDSQKAEFYLDNAFQAVSGSENQHSLVTTARLVKPFLQASAAFPLVGRRSLRLMEQVVRFEATILDLRRRLRRQSTITLPSTPSLSIQALGKVQVLVGRKPVTSADWQTQVTRDLFYLILSKPRGLAKEVVGETLWPDSSPAQLKLRFKNTIYRLRHALQQEAIVFDGETYTFNRNLDYEYDVDRFWEMLEQAGKTQSVEAKIKAFQAAIQLYQGPYLPEMGGDWVNLEREHLRQAFLGAGLDLARLYLEAQQFDKSLEVCYRLIAEDHCLENAYLAAMRASAAAGNIAEAARLYTKLRDTLKSERGDPPSPQVEALYLSLMG